MRPLVSLVGIYKNEIDSIESVIASARKAGVDRFTLLDTGSADGTIDAIKHNLRAARQNGDTPDALFQEPAVPFRSVPSQPIDFAATRNLVLAHEKDRIDPAVFTISLSGDEQIVDEAPGTLRAFLETKREASAGAFRVMMRRGTSTWLSTRVLRVDAGWKYQFPIHETPVGPNGETGGELIPGVFIDYAEGDQARMMKRLNEVDLPLLEYMAAEEPKDHAGHLSRARAILFLAQTHQRLALQYKEKDPATPWLNHQMTAMAYYMRRADLEGDEVDRNFALMNYFDVARKIELFTHEEFIDRLQLLAQMDPARPEVRYHLALHASQCIHVNPKTGVPDARKAAHFALEAARVAKEAKVKPLPFSTDSRIEWLSLQIAAECAKMMKQTELAKRTAERGVTAGGPADLFAEYM